MWRQLSTIIEVLLFSEFWINLFLDDLNPCKFDSRSL